MKIRSFFPRMAWFILSLLLMAPVQALAQGDPSDEPLFLQEELDQMLAPVALYPDALLAQILMASTYPLEIVQAERWLSRYPDLTGEALTSALEEQPWDPSVKSLVNFPDTLIMMSEKLEWTTRLGDAFIAQQEGVMNTIQTLRIKARIAGNLQTTPEQRVIVEKKIIVIEPASPSVVYVPFYNPVVVYGGWWYPSYPPYYLHPHGYSAARFVFSFTSGVAIGSAWGYAWGGCDWRRRHVNVYIHRNITVNRHINYNRYQSYYRGRGYVDKSGRGAWRHNPVHRRGVAYHNRGAERIYRGSRSRDSIKAREDFRGRHDARFRDAKIRDARTRDERTRDVQRRDARIRDARERNVQTRNARTRDERVRDTRTREVQPRDRRREDQVRPGNRPARSETRAQSLRPENTTLRPRETEAGRAGAVERGRSGTPKRGRVYEEREQGGASGHFNRRGQQGRSRVYPDGYKSDRQGGRR